MVAQNIMVAITRNIVLDIPKQSETFEVFFVTESAVPGAENGAEQAASTQLKPESTKRKMKESAVWHHFKKFTVLNLSECNYCQKRFKTTNATNVKRHLRICKPDVGKDVEEKDKPTPDLARTFKPLSAASFSKYYPRNNPKQLSFRKKLAFLAGGTSVAKLLLQSPEFKDCIYLADPKLRVPNYRTVNSDIKKLVAISKGQIVKLIKPIRRMTISSDIWTKKGQVSSYLGIIATFYCDKLKRKVQVVLSVRKIESVSHTAKDIIREMKDVLAKYDIQPQQVWRCMTDGASNMIASHRLRSSFFNQKHQATSVTEAGITNEDLHEYGSDEFASDSEDISQEVSVISESHGLSDCELQNLDSHSDFNGSYRRLTCFIHTLLRCLSVCETSVSAKKIQPVIKKARSVVDKFKKSHVLTESLIKAAGVALVSFCETRWNYIFNVFTRLLRVKQELIDIITPLKKDKYIITDVEWEQIEKITGFLKPFSEFTNTNSKEKDVVSSEVIVTIIHLYSHLDSYESDVFLDDFSQSIKLKLTEKFSHWFHEKPQQPLEGTYLSATLLDPRYRCILPEDKQNLAKNFIIKEYNRVLNESQSDLTTLPAQQSTQRRLQKSSRFPLLSDIKSSVLFSRSTIPQTTLDQFKIELTKYMESVEYDEIEESYNVLNFWEGMKYQFPLLSPLALDYLSIPSSTANVECIFSTAGSLSSRSRYSLEGENLEDEVLLIKNKKLLEEILKIDDLACNASSKAHGSYCSPCSDLKYN
ncbi:unnamed protein product [Allacma fusca]|uniref:BED-type domain-containing protein n=1 Tax=Allacma fusca TaxID=39272 RepID=A0A8J2P374_9HEXA|nr:unnamed protein product [Allacma fusca]